MVHSLGRVWLHPKPCLRSHRDTQAPLVLPEITQGLPEITEGHTGSTGPA